MKLLSRIAHDTRGISGTTLLLFVVFVLSVVLANGIAMNLSNRKKAEIALAKVSGFKVVSSLCGKAYNPATPECLIGKATSCGSYFLLQSDCTDQDEVLLNTDGETLGVCSTSEAKFNKSKCEKLLSPYTVATCLQQGNLCLQ